MEVTPAAKKRYLALENGEILEGYAFGADAQAVGEVVFSTNMSGFTESVTDPNYEGQIVVQTFPLTGNCGVAPDDIESRTRVKGYIVKQWCQTPSHFTCTRTLDTFLMENGIPGMYGADTRRLTKMIRTQGTLRGMLTDNPQAASVELLRGHASGDAVSRVTAKAPAHYPARVAKFHVALWDFGVRASTLRCLSDLGCSVTAVPAGWTAQQVLAVQPDGVLLSSGPGNPAQYKSIADEIRQVLASGIAVFGSGLGHQLLAMACGGSTAALPYGHRGNCSVRDIKSGRTLSASQNHGYTVQLDKLPQGAQLRYANADDGSCEGLDYTHCNAFSVQFKPEGCWNPRGEEGPYARFAAMMMKRRGA